MPDDKHHDILYIVEFWGFPANDVPADFDPVDTGLDALIDDLNLDCDPVTVWNGSICELYDAKVPSDVSDEDAFWDDVFSEMQNQWPSHNLQMRVIKKTKTTFEYGSEGDDIFKHKGCNTKGSYGVARRRYGASQT